MKRDTTHGGNIHVAIFVSHGQITGIATDHPNLLQTVVVHEDEDSDEFLDDDTEFKDGLSVTDLMIQGKYIIF